MAEHVRKLFRTGAIALAVVSTPMLHEAMGQDIETGTRHSVSAPRSPDRASAYRWVTLGTQGGPVASASRSQPANLLVSNRQAILVDVGDGAMERLAAAGVRPARLSAVFVSHLHADHTGGLFALLGLRNQLRLATPLRIYGPAGTRGMVAGLFAAMIPGAEGGLGVPGEQLPAPDANIVVIELKNGDHVDVDDVRVMVATNSHYDGSAQARARSLSYRFDTPGRSITYTGDTGPSAAVEGLARNTDLLVSEMIDLDGAARLLAREAPTLDAAARAQIVQHFSSHHLTTGNVAGLASRAGAKAVVLTHISADPAVTGNEASRYVAEVAAGFRGPVTVARDMEIF